MQLANLGSACSTAITYAMLAIGMFALSGCLFGWSQMLIHLCLNPVCFFGGPLVNKLGTKWSLVLGAMSFPIRGSSYYCNSKFGTQWVSELREKENLSSYAELTGAAPPPYVVPYLRRFHRWCRYRLLVRCRVGNHHVARPRRRTREVPGSVDRRP